MINCGIIGAGNIATDLMLKILKNKDFNLVCIFGRNNSSPGVKIAKKNVHFYINKINELKKLKNKLDIIFDASSAEYHLKNYKKYNTKNLTWIDLLHQALAMYLFLLYLEKVKYRITLVA